MKKLSIRQQNQIKQTITIFIVMAVLLLTLFFNYATTPVYAATSVQSEFEKVNVLDDLKGSTIEDETFSLANYNFDESKELQLLSLLEFCYSYKSDKQQDYGLYAYIYNPQGITFDLTNSQHGINIRACGKQSDGYIVYTLTFLNQSMQAGYEGLFFKFRVELSNSQKSELLNKLNSSERIYEVGEFQLMKPDKEFESKKGATYTYTGYTKGYGSDAAQTDTLKCISEGGLLTLSYETKSTAYRPEGSNGKNEFTQDSLHSVYFSVPNEIIEKYGDISKIHARWLNATLKPGLVTGNREMYERLLPIAAHQIPFSEIESEYEQYGIWWPYMYLGNCHYRPGTQYPTGTGTVDYGYGILGPYHKMGDIIFQNPERYGEKLDELLILLYASNGNADKSKFESTEELLNYVKNYPYVCPSELDPMSNVIMSGAAPKPTELVAGKYPEYLFSKYDTKYTDRTVESTEEIKLEDYKVSQKWWQHLFGGVTMDKQPFESLKAIQPVTTAELKGSDEEISKRLAVGKADLPDFLNFYDKAKDNDSTVFLFRFYQGEFMAQEATLAGTSKGWLGYWNFQPIDTNAYFFQTDVNLNFDIIDVSYTKGKTTTTIAAVMKPIDVIPNPTPPIITKPDFYYSFWKYGLGMIGGLIGTYIVIAIIYKKVKKI